MPPEVRRKWTVFVCAIAVIAIAMWMSAAIRGYPEADGLLHSGLRSPVMALELVHDERELESVLGRGRPDEARIAMLFRSSTWIDMAFIPAYVLLLVSLMGAVFDGGGGFWRLVRRIAVAFVLLAGVADYAENRGILEALDAPTLDLAAALRIHWPSVAKWGLLLAVSIVTALGLMIRGGRTPFGPVAARLAGLGIAVGVALAFRALEQPSYIERAVTMIAGAVLPACLVLPLIRR